MFKKVLIILAILLPLVLTAQVGKLTGTVTDKESGKPLAAANIFVPESKIGAASNDKGKFFLPGLPEGKYCFRITMISYKTVELKDVVITAGETTTLDIKLEPAIIEYPEVIIKKSDK